MYLKSPEVKLSTILDARQHQSEYLDEDEDIIVPQTRLQETGEGRRKTDISRHLQDL